MADEDRRIWAFSDAVHITKCVTNVFHDKVSVLYNNDIVSYKFFRIVYKLDTTAENTGLRTCPKVTAAHLDPTSFQRMNARLAFQLFSNSIANAIKVYRDTNSEEMCIRDR